MLRFTNDLDVPWVEKYRPDSVFSDNFVNQELIIKNLRFYASNPGVNMPHLIFSGPPGTGKTTAALALARDVLGDGFRQDTVLELNASDDRGIDMVRNTIKTFTMSEEFVDVPFKIVILDEADSITKPAQSAMRRIMELATRKSRFILMCNYADKIIDPIKSRCAIMRFKPLKPEHVKQHLKRIARHENIPVDDECLDALVYVGQGDMRRTINAFQMAVSVVEDMSKLDPNVIYEIEGFARPEKLKEILSAVANPDVPLEKIREMLSFMSQTSSRNLVLQLLGEIKNLKWLVGDPVLLARAFDALAEVDYSLTMEGDEEIQYMGLLARLRALLKEAGTRRAQGTN